MKISAINSYNYTSFSAKKKEERQVDNLSQNSSVNPGPLVLATVALAGCLTGCGNSPDTNIEQTEQTTAYVETTEPKSFDDVIEETITNAQNTSSIQSIPQSEREAVWYEVKKGDRLADIVKEYAQLHNLTPDSELVPYYEILEADNPGKWEDRNTIWVGTRFRVDGIMPENIIGTTKTPVEDNPVVEETVPNLPVDIDQNKDKDVVQVHSASIYFDKGTAKKVGIKDYEGFFNGFFVKADAKINGTVVKTQYEGVDSDSDVAQKVYYDKLGNITEIVNYKNDKPFESLKYEYTADSTIEIRTDKTGGSGKIDVIKSEYDKSADFVKSREFFSGGNSVARFDFINKSVRIGTETWTLNTFECDDEQIGSDKYVGSLYGQNLKFDAMQIGFCVEYVDENGQIMSREQYSANGNFICQE